MGKRVPDSERDRRLTGAEQRRYQQFLQQRQALLQAGYRETDLTISVGYANMMALVLGLPVVLVLGLAFLVRGPWPGHFAPQGLLVFLALFLVLVVVHELIHGLFWGLVAPDRFRAIEFGLMVQYLTPYCCCKQPLGRMPYAVGALMPTLFLGVLPAAMAVVTGWLPLFLMGALMILAGGGDLCILLELWRYRPQTADAVYLDHPYLCGLVAFERL